MKKEKSYFMNKMILKIGIALCFICLFGLNSASSQNGKVPPLVDVQEANSRLNEDVKLLDDQIRVIEGSGGTVDSELRFKQQLLKEVSAVLIQNNVGMTTFIALSSSSNYKGLKSDAGAFQDLLDGIWDPNMTELILRLAK